LEAQQLKPAIELHDVVKRFGRTVAVDHVSLSVEPGEIFAFLGPNGAGKTTTIKMITGLLRSDAGEVKVWGHDMGLDGLAAKAQMAYVPDQPYLYDKLTGREFLHFVARMYGVSIERRNSILEDLAERFQMKRFLDQLTESYSHGMKQKVVISSALLHEPRLLIIDEPMVGLDPKTVRQVKDLFLSQKARGETVFMSTHTLEIAETMADRIGIIHRGKLVAVGTMPELRSLADREHSLEDIFLRLTEEQDQHVE
jgi:ABC-2 type transport system ATP-binding protein